jgi:hypothetical protein
MGRQVSLGRERKRSGGVRRSLSLRNCKGEALRFLDAGNVVQETGDILIGSELSG